MLFYSRRDAVPEIRLLENANKAAVSQKL